MKRLVLAVVLTVFVSVSTLAGNIPTGDAVPPPPPPPPPDATVWLTQVVLAVTSLARP
ncbi:MAG TPA: hypothetical protein VF435_14680 [Pyrinomonadaceae bacterium]